MYARVRQAPWPVTIALGDDSGAVAGPRGTVVGHPDDALPTAGRLRRRAPDGSPSALDPSPAGDRLSDGIVLPRVLRGTLLDEGARLARLAEATPQILAAVAGETDAVAVEATLACLLWETFVQASWCGFYRRTGAQMLTVGPYQGGMGCLRIPFARGVCGACARSATTQLVADVRTIADHIACDDATRSELVLPVMLGERLIAVLDLDSGHLGGFSESEARGVEELLAHAFAGVTAG